MQKQKNVAPIKAKVVREITAANFSTNGKKGKPARPANMSDTEWFKVIANMRMDKVIKAMQGIVRLATLEGGEYTEKQANRIISAMRERLELAESTFTEVLSNPNPEKSIKAKVVKPRFFQ